MSRQIVVQSCGEHSGGMSTAGKAKSRRAMVNDAATRKLSVIQTELVNAPGADRFVILDATQISRTRSQLASKKNQHTPGHSPAEFMMNLRPKTCFASRDPSQLWST